MTDGVAIKIIGNYQITGELSAGGMGTVYRGHHLSLPREVVIKAISLHEYNPQHHAHLKTRFFREALVQSQLDHPHIVRVHEFFAQQENHYIVMEYVAGMSVADLLQRQGALEPAAALGILKQVLRALDYAHNFSYVDEARQQHTGLVHRDIKPANILLDAQLNAKLTDFGIVKAGGDHKGQLTSTGFQPGTIEYMSPEQICGSEVDTRSDIYSLGITLYQMLSGRVPFSASSSGSDYEVRKGHVELAPPSLHKLRPELSTGLLAIVDKALAKKTEDRFQSAREFLAAIEAHEQHSTKDFSTSVMPHDPSFVRDTARLSGSVRDDAPTIDTLPKSVAASVSSLSAPVSSSRKIPALPIIMALAVLLTGSFIAWQFVSRSAESGAPATAATPAVQISATPVVSAPLPQSVMRFFLKVLAGNQERRTSGAEELTKKDEFRFHFTPSQSGYLYIVSPGEKNVPTTFLTTKPSSASGVTTNRIEAGTEFVFPGGTENVISLDRSLQTTVFTVILSREPLTVPTFLADKAGHKLTLNEQSEFEAFRQQANIITAALQRGDNEMIATIPADKAADHIVILEIPIRQR